MSVGSWTSPLFGVGGGHDERGKTIYQALKSELGDGALSDSTSSAVEADTIATTRLLMRADAWIRRRLNQWYPETMGYMLDRWEAILGIVPRRGDTRAQRILRIAPRMCVGRGALSGAISQIAISSFSPWATNVRYMPLALATASWPGGTPSAPTSWTSDVAHIVVEYIRPAGATDDDAQSRRDACYAALDDALPAWATFDMSETQEGYSFGFTLDLPNLDVSVFST